MDRRRFLAACVPTVAAVSGCAQRRRGGRTESPTPATTRTPTDGTPETTRSTTDASRVTPGPSQFEDVECPSFGDPDQHVCAHTAEAPAAFLQPLYEEVGAPTEGCVPSAGFRAVTNVDELTVDTGTVYVARGEGDTWTRVPPTNTETCPQCRRTLSTDDTHEWFMPVEQTHPSTAPREDVSRLGPLESEPGVHAFGVVAELDDETLQLVALFRLLDGPDPRCADG